MENEKIKVEISKEELEAFEAITEYVVNSNGLLQLLIMSSPEIKKFISMNKLVEANMLVATCYKAVERMKKESQS